ncbi:MAG: hypothetical protein ABIN00_08110 [candidate division WOR-3 bacterium]
MREILSFLVLILQWLTLFLFGVAFGVYWEGMKGFENERKRRKQKKNN